MFGVRAAFKSDAAQIADFQYKMALQTQHLELNKQLVLQAVSYIIQHPEYGQYFIPIQQNQPAQPLGSLLITYQNSSSWWIQSVYVKQQYRRKGLFTLMFKSVLQKGKISGAKKIQLYVQKQNIRAKKTYQKLGMYCNGNQFYGYQLVYNATQIAKNLQQKIQNKITIQADLKSHQNITNFKNLTYLSGQQCEQNKKILIIQDKQCVGYCEYFYQFSDWRFGFIVYVSCFKAETGKEKIAADGMLKFLYQNSKLKVGAIRIITKQNQLKLLSEVIPDMHKDVYDVMQIDL